MKIRCCFFVLIFSVFVSYAQSNRYVDSTGKFLWQYHRSVSKDYTDSTKSLFTFVFINGEEQMTIAYRHEVLKSEIKWVETEKGYCVKDGKVEQISANLPPNSAIVWKFLSSNAQQNPKSNAMVVEQGAILIMNKDFQVRKERFPEQTVE